METIINSKEKLLEEARKEITEKINSGEMPYEISAIAEHIKNKGILPAGFELNNTAQGIYKELEGSVA